jgi:hypothetical protein
LTTTIDPIYQSSWESDSEGHGEVYMVKNGEELPDKTVEEIQREANEERGTTTCRTTWVHQKMSLGMALP